MNNAHSTLRNIRQHQPLILCLTNFVSAEFVANGLLALGAAPLMSQAEEEVESLLVLAHALVINIGTLDPRFIHLAHKAGSIAKKLGKPVILDAVGAGASTLRTKTSLDLMAYSKTLHGNASEVMALAGMYGKTYGVESTHASEEAIAAGTYLATHHHQLVVISGSTDIIIHQKTYTSFTLGSPIMKKVTGMGCLLTAVIAAFQAVLEDPYQAAIEACTYFSLVGEEAAKKSPTPGSFKSHFLDLLSTKES